jgi:argininosuccinate lyase
MSFRSAHEIVGKMVAACLDKNCQLESLTLPEMNTFSPLIKEDIYQILSAKNAVQACIPSEKIAEEIRLNEDQIKSNSTKLTAHA